MNKSTHRLIIAAACLAIAAAIALPSLATAQMREFTGRIDRVSKKKMIVDNRMGDKVSFVHEKGETEVEGTKTEWKKLKKKDWVVVSWKFIETMNRYDVFVGVTIIVLITHGFKFFSLFFPHGAPIVSAPILVPIEIISYFSRPISLSVRLFANMTVGHVLLKVIGGGVVGLGSFFIIPGLLPFAFLVAITMLEVMIAVIQAYVFAILTCVYLNDALHLH